MKIEEMMLWGLLGLCLWMIGSFVVLAFMRMSDSGDGDEDEDGKGW